MAERSVRRFWLVATSFLLLVTACEEQPQSVEPDMQAIVIGAGISGLSAAVEMGRSGLNVLVIDMNSVAGGHTMLAGGVAMVATPLQEQLGIEDSAESAYRDWTEWTEDGDADWTRYYSSNSREMIYDWVTNMGVEFVRVVPSHGNSVPRFHFTQGRAAHLVLPIFRTALQMSNISFLWNSRAEELLLNGDRVSGVRVKNLRSGETRSLHADNVVLATGGFETDVKRVLSNWIPGLPRPDRLLIGAAISATGSGHDMATDAGAALVRTNRHYIYINGIVDPRDQQQSHALTAGNDFSLWVNSGGRRFTNETGFDKDILVDLLQQEPSNYWMLFDEATRDSFGVRGAAWLKTPSEDHLILDDPKVVKRADNLPELAIMAGLPVDAVVESVSEFNAMIDFGEDTAFGRFSNGDSVPPKIQQAPFYAVQMFPMTRKNMGGIAIDTQARALDKSGKVLPGLYAVGELNGSLGINGKHGLDGMFLGPAILSGRLAGQSIVAASRVTKAPEILSNEHLSTGELRHAGDWQATMTTTDLEVALSQSRDGYWHFQVSHQLVLERGYACTGCHSADLPFAAIGDRESRLIQSALCTRCH